MRSEMIPTWDLPRNCIEKRTFFHCIWIDGPEGGRSQSAIDTYRCLQGHHHRVHATYHKSQSG
jgi:hypothetical protein